MKRYKQSEIEEVVTVLKNDGVISVPTDTVYGISSLPEPGYYHGFVFFSHSSSLIYALLSKIREYFSARYLQSHY